MHITKTEIKEIKRHKSDDIDGRISVVHHVTMTIGDKDEDPIFFVTFRVLVEGWEGQPYEALLLEALLAARKLISEQKNPIESRLDSRDLSRHIRGT